MESYWKVLSKEGGFDLYLKIFFVFGGRLNCWEVSIEVDRLVIFLYYIYVDDNDGFVLEW